MSTWSLVSTANGVGSPSGQLVLVRLAITTSAVAAGIAAAWPAAVQVPIGDGNVTSFPVITAPPGWPEVVLPGP